MAQGGILSRVEAGAGRTMRMGDGLVIRRQCPRYGRLRLRRSHCLNEWEYLLQAIHLYPFRCEGCKQRILRFSLREP
jgi:hypothetical protein